MTQVLVVRTPTALEQWLRVDGKVVTLREWMAGDGTTSEFVARSMPLINRHAQVPLNAEDVIIRGMRLCNNQPDYYHSWFEDRALDEVVELAPGAPLMRMHNTKTGAPEGRIFDSKITELDGWRWADCSHYFLNDEEGQALARRSDGGLDREVSIGWRCGRATCSECSRSIMSCDHIPGDIYSRGFCRFGFSGIQSVLEGSNVYRGGQKDTTTYIPDGARSATNVAIATAVQRFMDAMSGDVAWHRIAATKREFVSGMTDAMPREFRAAAEGYRRAMGMGTICATPGDRGNTQSLRLSKTHFGELAAAKRYVRDMEFVADVRTDTDREWVFEQWPSGEREEARVVTVDPGVSARIMAPVKRTERSDSSGDADWKSRSETEPTVGELADWLMGRNRN